MEHPLLPLGTVLRVRHSDALLMIVGYYPVHPETKRIMRYLAVNYPVGIAGNGPAVLLDDERIEEILWRGSDEATLYNRQVQKIMEAKLEVDRHNNGETLP